MLVLRIQNVAYTGGKALRPVWISLLLSDVFIEMFGLALSSRARPPCQPPWGRRKTGAYSPPTLSGNPDRSTRSRSEVRLDSLLRPGSQTMAWAMQANTDVVVEVGVCLGTLQRPK